MAGDLVFTDEHMDAGVPHYVATYLGRGCIAEARQPGERITISALPSPVCIYDGSHPLSLGTIDGRSGRCGRCARHATLCRNGVSAAADLDTAVSA